MVKKLEQIEIQQNQNISYSDEIKLVHIATHSDNFFKSIITISILNAEELSPGDG